MNELWQNAVALAAVALAAGWLVRRFWRAWRTAQGGPCGGCGSCAASGSAVPAVSAEALATSAAKLSPRR